MKKFYLNPAVAYEMYYRHYTQNSEWKKNSDYLKSIGLDYTEPKYTFFSDMAIYLNNLPGLKSYVERMLKRFCKNNPEAYSEMIDSLNYMGWFVFEQNGRKECELSDYLFNKFNELYDKKTWSKYVSEKQMDGIYYALN